MYNVFGVKQPAPTILLGNSTSLKASGEVQFFMPSKYGGDLILKIESGDGRVDKLWYKPDAGTTWTEKNLTSPSRYTIPNGTDPGWYKLAIRARDCQYKVALEDHPKIADPDDPTKEWKPWSLSWYPMARDAGTKHLYSAPGPLTKYDLAVGQMTQAEYQQFQAGGAPGNGAFRRQYRSYMVADGGKYGQRFEKSILDEKDAEKTVGWDFNNADNDNNPWNGWDVTVEADFMNDSGSRMPDGDTNDKDPSDPNKNRSWYGHCDGESAVVASYPKPPTASATYTWGTGTPQVFSVNDKYGLLVAAYTWNEKVDAVRWTPAHANPGKWHEVVAASFHDGKPVVANLYRSHAGGNDPVWNYVIARFWYSIKQTDASNLKKATVNAEIRATSLMEAYRYQYSIEFKDDGFPKDSGTWGSDPRGGQEPAYQQPDDAWLPTKPKENEEDARWEGKLSIARIKEILNNGETQWQW